MMATIKKFYKGFNTKDYEKSGGSFSIYNVFCIKNDILNDILTIVGERVMMPNEGTRIPLMTFEPNDISSHRIIEADIRKVIANDQRVDVIALDVFGLSDKNAIVAVIRLFYKEFDIVDDLRITINSN